MRSYLIAICCLLVLSLSSCSRSACPAYDSYSTNEFSKPGKGKKNKNKTSLYGKKGPG
jgi:hypothetical protein